MAAYTPPSRRGGHHTKPSRLPLIGLLCLLFALLAVALVYRRAYNVTGQMRVDVLHQALRDDVPRHGRFPAWGATYRSEFFGWLPGPKYGVLAIDHGTDCIVWYDTWLFGHRVERLCSERVPGEGPSPPWMDPHRPERDAPEVIHDMPAETAR